VEEREKEIEDTGEGSVGDETGMSLGGEGMCGDWTSDTEELRKR
jgi:hypothetical protein